MDFYFYNCLSHGVNQMIQKGPVLYITGFLLSIILTLTAFYLVSSHMLGKNLISAILVLAVLQLIVQLIFFLHLGDTKSRLNSTLFLSTMSLVLLLVGASIWIMGHLNYNHQTQTETEKYLIEQEGIRK